MQNSLLERVPCMFGGILQLDREGAPFCLRQQNAYIHAHINLFVCCLSTVKTVLKAAYNMEENP